MKALAGVFARRELRRHRRGVAVARVEDVDDILVVVLVPAGVGVPSGGKPHRRKAALGRLVMSPQGAAYDAVGPRASRLERLPEHPSLGQAQLRELIVVRCAEGGLRVTNQIDGGHQTRLSRMSRRQRRSM